MLEAAKKWFVRRMLSIPWTTRKTNEGVLPRVGVKRELMAMIMRRQIGFVWQILTGNGLEEE